MTVLKYVNFISEATGATYKYYLPQFIQANNSYTNFGDDGVSYEDYRKYVDQFIVDITEGSCFYDANNTGPNGGAQVIKYFPYALDIQTILPINKRITFDNGNYIVRSSSITGYAYSKDGTQLFDISIASSGGPYAVHGITHLLAYDYNNDKFVSGSGGSVYSNTYMTPAAVTTPYNDKFASYANYNFGNDNIDNKINDFFTGVKPGEIDPSNPYSGGGTSAGGGGGGSYNDGSDIISVPSLPSLSALNTGFFSMYSPSLSQLNALASWLWSTDPVTNLTKLFGEPLKAIIGLSLVPVTPAVGGSQNIKLGNLDSGIPMSVLSSQYVQLDCGSVSLSEYYGAAMDYSPYTQVQLYVPYCGVYNVDVDDVMAGTSNLKYNIDLLSGACSAMLTCNKGDLNSVVYNYTGNVNTNIPVTSQDWTQLIRSVISAAGSVGMAIATSGASLAAEGTAGATAASAIAGGSAGTAIGSASNVLGSAKPTISRGGGLSTAMGALSVQVPYFIISRPVQSIPESYQHYSGLPANITKKLSDISGMTVIENIFINLPNATDNEKNEIETLLKGGVIL